MNWLAVALSPILAVLVALDGCGGHADARATHPAPVGAPDLAALPNLPSLSQARVLRSASEIDYELLDQPPVLQSSSGADYTPGALALTPPDAATLAWAVFGLGGLPTDGTLYPVNVAVAADAQYWLAVSDYSKQRWMFLPYQASGIYAITGGASLISPGGTFYVALIAWQQAAGFTGLRVTTNEMPVQPHQLWYYLQTNLQVDGNLGDAIAQLQVASDAGYTKVLYADSKLDYIDQVWSHYIDNLKAFDAAAKSKGIEVVPSMLGVGYAGAMLIHNSNLVEGQPVKDCLFQVSGGEANVVQDPATAIVNGDFENHSGNTFPSWNQMDGPGVSTFADAGRTGGTSIRFENFPAGNPAGNDRIQQVFTVEPWHYYVVHFWLKTQNVVPIGSLWARIFSADQEFRQLTYNTFPLSPTQDWTEYHLIFNSQDKTQVYLYLGIWSGQSGRFWVDDVSVENGGLVNLIRRPGAPFRVTSDDGSVEYTEGVDYKGAGGDQVTDPNMGNVAGYMGTYDLWHAAPSIVIPAGSRITDGQQVKVSYYHAVFTDDMKEPMSISEDETFTICQNLLQTIHDTIDPHCVLIAVDENRAGGWDEPGFSAGTTTGQLLAQFTTRVDQIAKAIDPTWRLITWSDMYDPNHNMKPQYYLCYGGTEGAIDGLPASWDVGNWNFFTDPQATLAHFSDHGNRQILAGYYDEGASISIGGWLDQAKGVPGVYAVMYTTWASDYSQLANFADAVRSWEAANP